MTLSFRRPRASVLHEIWLDDDLICRESGFNEFGFGEISKRDQPIHLSPPCCLPAVPADHARDCERSQARAPVTAVHRTVIGRTTDAVLAWPAIAEQECAATDCTIVMQCLDHGHSRIPAGIIDRWAKQRKEVMDVDDVRIKVRDDVSELTSCRM